MSDGGRIGGAKGAIAAVTIAAAFMAGVDISIVNTALPMIRAAVGASLAETAWIASGYLIANVKSRTIITAMDKSQMKDRIFTNIDSAVLV